jgi:hypothetical protein
MQRTALPHKKFSLGLIEDRRSAPADQYAICIFVSDAVERQADALADLKWQAAAILSAN